MQFNSYKKKKGEEIQPLLPKDKKNVRFRDLSKNIPPPIPPRTLNVGQDDEDVPTSVPKNLNPTQGTSSAPPRPRRVLKNVNTSRKVPTKRNQYVVKTSTTPKKQPIKPTRTLTDFDNQTNDLTKQRIQLMSNAENKITSSGLGGKFVDPNKTTKFIRNIDNLQNKRIDALANEIKKIPKFKENQKIDEQNIQIDNLDNQIKALDTQIIELVRENKEQNAKIIKKLKEQKNTLLGILDDNKKSFKNLNNKVSNVEDEKNNLESKIKMVSDEMNNYKFQLKDKLQKVYNENKNDFDENLDKKLKIVYEKLNRQSLNIAELENNVYELNNNPILKNKRIQLQPPPLSTLPSSYKDAFRGSVKKATMSNNDNSLLKSRLNTLENKLNLIGNALITVAQVTEKNDNVMRQIGFRA